MHVTKRNVTMKKSLQNEVDDRWRKKGQVHTKKENKPEVCTECKGYGSLENGEACPSCEGIGEIW